jgi:hypothetical protein
MFVKLLEAIFGCHHSRYSFPVTMRGAARRAQAASLTGTYVACLECGKEFPYDWQEMKVITSPQPHRERVAALATKHAACLEYSDWLVICPFPKEPRFLPRLWLFLRGDPPDSLQIKTGGQGRRSLSVVIT